MTWNLLFNSVGVTVAATVWAVLLGVPVALSMQWVPAWGRRMLLAGAVGVLALPSFLVAGLWMRWVGFAGAWRLGGGEWIERYFPMLVSAAVLGGLLWPLTTLLLCGAWDRLERRWLDVQPALRGGSLLREVYLPLGRGALVQAAALTSVLALTNFSVPSLFQARVWPESVWVEFSTRYDTAAALAKSWPMMLVSLGLALLALRHPLIWPLRAVPGAGGVVRERLGAPMAWTGLGLAVLVLALTGGLPVVGVLGQGRTWTELRPALEAAWPAWVRSVLYAAGGASLALGLGVLLARWRWPAVLAPWFILPGIFEGMLLLRLFEFRAFDAVRVSPGLVVVALAVRYAFVGWFVAARCWRGADRGLKDAAALAGAGVAWRWRHVVGPGSRTVLIGAWYLLYVLALWDVETLVLIVPPGGDSMALMVFNLLHYGHNPQVSAHCVWLGVAALLPLALGAGVAVLRRGGIQGVRAALMAGLSGLALGGGGCSKAPDAASVRLDSKLFETVSAIGSKGTGPGFFLKPRSVAVDGADDVYAVDMTSRVQRFDREGRWRLMWQMPETDRGKAKGMATSPEGGLLVVEPHYHRVNRFTPEGVLQAQWGVHGTNAGEFWFPRAIAVGPKGDCFVSEYGVVERVQRFTADGTRLLGSFGSEGSGPGQLSRAEGIGTDRDGNVYVADSCHHRIQVFTPDGKLLRMHGRAGQGPGEFSYPYDVRVDARGYQYVCEFGNSRVQVLDERDRPVEILGGPGAAVGRMSNPWSLCLDSKGNLYVADSLNHRLLKFTRRRAEGALAALSKDARRTEAAEPERN